MTFNKAITDLESRIDALSNRMRALLYKPHFDPDDKLASNLTTGWRQLLFPFEAIEHTMREEAKRRAEKLYWLYGKYKKPYTKKRRHRKEFIYDL